MLHSVWRLGDDVAVLPANTTPDTVTVDFVPRAMEWGLAGETLQALEYQGGQPPTPVNWPREQARRLTVPGYSLAAWLFGSGEQTSPDQSAQAATAREVFSRLYSFQQAAAP